MILAAALACVGGSTHALEPLDSPAAERVVLHTTVGDITLALYPNAAPKHVEQILQLVKMRVYDGTYFYRIDPSYIAQVASAQDRATPLTLHQAAGIRPLKAEFTSLRHVRKSLSMARDDGDPDSAQTSFCILLADAPWLDGKYTVFGRVEGSEATLQALSAVKTANHLPLKRVTILNAEVALEADLPKIVSPIAIPQPDSDAPASRSTAVAAWLVAATLILNLVAFWALTHRPIRDASAWSLLGVLTGFFTLLVLAFPSLTGRPWLGAAVFFGFTGLFKLLSGFESPPKNP